MLRVYMCVCTQCWACVYICAERVCACVLIICACDYWVTCVCVCAHVCAGCVRVCVCAECVVPTCPCLSSPPLQSGPMSNWELLASGRLWLYRACVVALVVLELCGGPLGSPRQPPTLREGGCRAATPWEDPSSSSSSVTQVRDEQGRLPCRVTALLLRGCSRTLALWESPAQPRAVLWSRP